MQAFERGDWLAAQVQQQVDSYSQSLACRLLAAGHRPPEWLLPSATLSQGALPLPLPFSSVPTSVPRIRVVRERSGVDSLGRLGLISIRIEIAYFDWKGWWLLVI